MTGPCGRRDVARAIVVRVACVFTGAFMAIAAAVSPVRMLRAQGERPTAAAPTAPAATARDTTPPPVWTRVTYISGASVYVEVGSKDGLREGSHLEIVRGGAVTANLVVAYISSSRASCSIANSTAEPVVGDSVRFTPIATVATSVAGAGGAAAAAQGRARPSALRGRIGLRYLVVDPGTGAGGTLTQPAFDLRLDGAQLGGTPFGLAVDVRSQLSMISTAPGLAGTPPQSVTRTYQAALLFNAGGSPLHVAVGRQFAGALSTVGLFDGVAIDLVQPHVSYGVLGGYQPDITNLGFSTLTTQYGAYVQLHNKPAQSPLWSVTLGGVGAYDGGQIDREFAYLRATFNSRWLSIYATQEVDVNRGWKAASEGSSVTPTSTFAMAQVMVTDALSVYAGIDNRRNVRLYRDYINPESTFDDAFREGIWAGSSLSALGHVRISADVRESSGGASGQTESVTASASLWRFTSYQLGLHARATRYTGDLNSGDLQSLSLEASPWSALRVQVTSGVRSSAVVLDPNGATRTTWTGIDADLGIGRSVYLWFSLSRESGPTGQYGQSYSALSYRF